jgi:hypothetical protein
MATTQTAVAEPQQIPLTLLNERRPQTDVEAFAPTPEVPPSDAVDAHTAAPIFKLVVAGFSFFCAGVNDGTLGPLIPYMLKTFGIGTGNVAIMQVACQVFSKHCIISLTNKVTMTATAPPLPDGSWPP